MLLHKRHGKQHRLQAWASHLLPPHTKKYCARQLLLVEHVVAAIDIACSHNAAVLIVTCTPSPPLVGYVLSYLLLIRK